MNIRICRLIFPAIALALTSPAFAATRAVTLNVPGMTCPTCPITVKKALNKVPGVARVDVMLEKKQVVVIFDDSKTDAQSLVNATTNAGYPSKQDGAAK